jgi:hypothetical protein
VDEIKNFLFGLVVLATFPAWLPLYALWCGVVFVAFVGEVAWEWVCPAERPDRGEEWAR